MNDEFLQKRQELEQLKAIKAEKILNKLILLHEEYDAVVTEIRELEPQEATRVEKYGLKYIVRDILKNYPKGLSVNQIHNIVMEEQGYETDATPISVKNHIYIILSNGMFTKKVISGKNNVYVLNIDFIEKQKEAA